MKLLVLSGWLMLTCLVFGQKTVLPYVNNGKWSLIDSTGRTLAETPFSYIHSFDDAGYTFFSQNGGYGILNSKGEIVVKPQYADVQQKGHGHYQLLTEKGWIPFEPGGFRLIGNDTIHSFEMLSGSWALTGTKTDWYLEHLTSGKRWPLPDSTATYKILHDHLLLDLTDTNDLLINGAGEVVLKGNIYLETQNELYHVNTQNRHYVFGAEGKWPYESIKRVFFEPDALFIQTEKEGIYLSYNGSVILRGDYSYIGSFNNTYLTVGKNGLRTLFDRKTLRPALPFKYESILAAGKNYQVQLNGNNGLIDSAFREMVPCKYQRISLKGNLAFVYELNYVGIYSLLRKTEILPPVYNSIRENNNRYKASRNDFMTIIELDAGHKVLKTAKIDHTINVTLMREYATGTRPRKFIDPRLFPLGWFLDSTLVTPPKGEPSYFALKWGLRNDQDSVVIPASIPELIYVPQAPFTMQYTGQADYERGLKARNFKPVYLPTGKVLSKYTLLDFDTTDFRFRNFMRVATAKGLGILCEDGSFRPYSYIEQNMNRNLLYCNAKEIVPIEMKNDTEEKTPVPWMDFFNNYIPHPAVFKLNDYSKCVGLTYPDGEWNYLSPEGKPLFSDTFSFAFPFTGNQAIVKKGQKWGVVNQDTLFIPAKYSRIERVIAQKDTFFVARIPQGGTRLLDSLSRTLPTNGQSVSAHRNNTVILEDKEGKQLADALFKPLSEHYPTMKYLKNGLILAKNKKEYTVLNTNGEVLYSGETPPEEILHCGRMILTKGATYDLYDAHMQPLLTGCSKISESGRYTIAEKAGESFVYTEQTLLLDGVAGIVLVDTILNNFLVWNNEKAVFYQNDTKAGKLKLTKPSHFYNNLIFLPGKDTCLLIDRSGKPFMTIPEIDELIPFSDGRLLIKTKAKSHYFFDSEWHSLLPEEKKFRQLEQLSDDIFCYKNEKGQTLFYHLETNRIDTTSYQTGYGTFTGGRLLVKTGTRYCYIDERIRPVSKCTYVQAIPFSGRYAAVADQRGWTIIDHNCNPVAYPNFGKIETIAKDVFSTQQLPLNGVYNTAGKLIVPIEFQEIRFLSNGLILGIRDGAFTYFRHDGTLLRVL